MTEDEARAWLGGHVPRGTMVALQQLGDFVLAESAHQNLIASSTAEHIWARHIVDSAQLLRHAPDAARTWIDLGSGAGFPGMVVAVMRPDLSVVLVESRRKRIEFLAAMAVRLGVAERVRIAGSRVEALDSATFDVISARAFAPMERLLPLAHRFSAPETVWLLPKGRSAASELDAVSASWQGGFRIEPSLTDPDAAIIVAERVEPRGRSALAKGAKGKK